MVLSDDQSATFCMSPPCDQTTRTRVVRISLLHERFPSVPTTVTPDRSPTTPETGPLAEPAWWPQNGMSTGSMQKVTEKKKMQNHLSLWWYLPTYLPLSTKTCQTTFAASIILLLGSLRRRRLHERKDDCRR